MTDPIFDTVSLAPRPQLMPFLTGSRVYGTPREDSDTDLVVYVSQADLAILRATAGVAAPDLKSKYPEKGATLMFGKLNLICVEDAAKFEAWRSATEALKARKPVTRDEAVRTIKEACGEETES